MFKFLYPAYDSGGVLWFHNGRQCVCPTSVSRTVHPAIRIPFPDNLSKHQWIFTKLGVCIGIVEIWFGIVNGQILKELSAHIFVAG